MKLFYFMIKFLHKKNLFLILVVVAMSAFSQQTSIGFYYGPSVGYNAIYAHNASHNSHGILDLNFDTGEPFFSSIGMLNDTDFSNNVEIINGSVFGIKASLPVVTGVSIQPEIQYQQLDFNHIIYQNGDAVFNNIVFGLSGLNHDKYKIANYFWRVNYLNFPFVIKLHPINNVFFQLGMHFGFLIKAEETPAFARFNLEDEYVEYEVFFSERVVYEFFDSNSGQDNHGFDKNEWPFNWNTSVIFGFGYEAKSFYFSLRYSMGLVDFFKEIPDQEDDFFDNYNVDFDNDVFDSFNISEPILNNNFKLHAIYFTIGYHLSN